MKALTLTQPWATLVAIGAKRIETRSWRTDYRGPLAIHAGKCFPKWAEALCHDEPFRGALINSGIKSTSKYDLPLGAIVATCELVSVKEINARQYTFEKSLGWKWIGPDGTAYCFELDDQEKAFGDYGPFRYAWMLHNIKALVEPIPARGAPSIFELNLSL